ncbi:MAG TPA: hypothetical protein VKV24_19830 [Casimicrobiaceae bacterium]|nr:hypothetical protein [Casimicrobiaceae bacterium]
MDAREQKIRICTSGDGVRLADATLGAGPPVLKVGSSLTHLEHDCQSPVWIPWLTELSRRNALYRYDPARLRTVRSQRRALHARRVGA